MGRNHTRRPTTKSHKKIISDFACVSREDVVYNKQEDEMFIQYMKCDQCGKEMKYNDETGGWVDVHELRMSRINANTFTRETQKHFCSSKCAREWFDLQLINISLHKEG